MSCCQDKYGMARFPRRGSPGAADEIAIIGLLGVRLPTHSCSGRTLELTQKRTLGDLARWGGPPLFAEPRHVGLPTTGNRERFLDRVNGILDRRWLTNDGPCVRELEERIGALLGVKHCLAMASGTVALAIAARALGLSGEVIVPALTFVATAHALQWQGITPVFCDVDPATHSIDPAQVEALITSRTTGIVGVHLWGRPCDVDALTRVARAHGLKLLFDAAHAFGCSHAGRMVGTHGDAEVFSFTPRHEVLQHL